MPPTLAFTQSPIIAFAEEIADVSRVFDYEPLEPAAALVPWCLVLSAGMSILYPCRVLLECHGHHVPIYCHHDMLGDKYSSQIVVSATLKPSRR